MTTRINGNMYSHASVTLRVGRTLVTAFKSIDYSDKRERAKGYGASRSHKPFGKTRGKYTPENVKASIEKAELQALRQALADESSSTSFGDFEFEIVVQYDEPDGAGGSRHITDTIQRCTWAGNAAKSEESPDPLYDEVEFDCLGILWNGLSLFAAEGEAT